MRKVFVDTETRGRSDLTKVGHYVYAESSEVLLLAYMFEGDGAPIVVEGEYSDLGFLTDPDVLKIAHNAPFDFEVLKAHVPGLDYSQWLDTRALCAQRGLPGTLAGAAKALDVPGKAPEGKDLIKLFSVPDADGQIGTKELHPDEWERFRDYCAQDVKVLSEISKRLNIDAHLTSTERSVEILDHKISSSGIPVDTGLVSDLITVRDKYFRKLDAKISELTGGVNPSSPKMLLTWLIEQDPSIGLESTTKADLEAAMARASGDVLRVIKLVVMRRQTSLKKLDALRLRASTDGRLRGSTRYFGTHTGRWAGIGVQLQNLPAVDISEEEIESKILSVKSGTASLTDVKPLIRPCLTGGFLVADYSAIEARVLAWLAGEEWVLEAFRSGRDIYVETAAMMRGISYEDAKEFRKEGKIAVLALGYGGGPGALKAFGADMDLPAMVDLVRRYRSANSKISRFWKQLEHAFLHTGQAGSIRVLGKPGIRQVVLPSGRSLIYRGVKRLSGDLGYISPRSGAFTKLYGGKLAENVTQAVARDVLAEGLLELDRRGFEILGHVHDEVLVADDDREVGEVIAALEVVPEWAEGLPLAAAGDATKRYRKV